MRTVFFGYPTNHIDIIRLDPADLAGRGSLNQQTEDLAIAFDDPELPIPWPLPISTMSKLDKDAPPSAKVKALLE